MIVPKFIIFSAIALALFACQSSSQSSSSSPSMPSPSSQSSSSSRSMPAPASQQAGGDSTRQAPSVSQAQQNQAQGQATSASSLPTATINSDSERELGSRERLPDAEQIGDRPGERDSSTGDLDGANGNTTSNGGGLAGQSGDYSLDTLPTGVLSGNSGVKTSGPMTSAERARVLDERLRKGYETFDGFILSERERAQNESNAAGSAQPGSDGGGGAAANRPQTIQEASASSSGVPGSPSSAAVTQQSNETFSPPDDIPSGRDDDVVARQLREAAMSEPDPELREALWDEYRNYTGIGGGADQ